MEGIFKGWIAEKPFGFITRDDDSSEIFVHKNAVPATVQLWPGSRVEFDAVEDAGKRPKATNIRVLSNPERRQGRIKSWNSRWGTVEVDGSGEVIVLHASTLSASEALNVTQGVRVEFGVKIGGKGLEAKDVVVLTSVSSSDPLMAFADLGSTAWPDPLAILAEKEPWEHKHGKSFESLPILRSYIRYTFQRLQEMQGGIRYSQDHKKAGFNTGLVTHHQEDIFALFETNPISGKQAWRLVGFKKASDWDVINSFGSDLPPLANYFDDPSVLLYDRRCELYINVDHVIDEHIERFPKHLRANPFVARQLMISAEATTKKRVYRNYKTAVPQFFRDRGGPGSVQLLLPLCLESPAHADLALVVERSDAGNAYRGSSVLTLDMAYNNARLLARPDNEWLQP